MRFQPNRDYRTNDDIQTPRGLARALVAELSPSRELLETCAGDGAFLDAMPSGSLWCEIVSVASGAS